MGRRIALVCHPERDAAREVAARIVDLLGESGCEVVEAALGGRTRPDLPGVEDFDGCDVVISLGGDGTFLHAAHLARDHGVPVLGVNLGRLGFLAEVEPTDLARSMSAVASGAIEVVDLPTLEVRAQDAEGTEVFAGWALNEVSVEKSARQRVLVMDVDVAGTHVTRVPADAVVVSTPTGSTAYAFSAGGPILSPRVAGTLVTPVAPHSVFSRTIVAAVDEPVVVAVVEDQEPAIVSCDGRDPVVLPAGGRVVATGNGRPVRVARVDDVDFYEVVRRKFGLR